MTQSAGSETRMTCPKCGLVAGAGVTLCPKDGTKLADYSNDPFVGKIIEVNQTIREYTIDITNYTLNFFGFFYDFFHNHALKFKKRQPEANHEDVRRLRVAGFHQGSPMR